MEKDINYNNDHKLDIDLYAEELGDMKVASATTISSAACIGCFGGCFACGTTVGCISCG